MLNRKFPFYYQANSMECGLACMKMITAFYGKRISNHSLREYSDFERSGTSMMGLCNTAARIGLESEAFALTMEELINFQPGVPCIIHWNQYHFVILYKIEANRFYVADPAKGLLRYKESDFREYAMVADGHGVPRMSALFFKPTGKFQQLASDETVTPGVQAAFFWDIIRKKRKFFLVIAALLLVSMSIQFSIPFFTKSIVDMGISAGNQRLVLFLAIGQAAVIFGRTTFDIVRSWLSLHLSVRINFDLIVKFLEKMFRLPLIFLESRKIGDLMQRITDNYRIESFITNITVSSAFSILTILVYSVVICFYNIQYLLVFLFSGAVYILWNIFFLKKRQVLDWKRFDVSARNQSMLIQMFSGIHDLRINSAESFYFSAWEKNQKDIIQSNFDVMRLNQVQQTGATVIYEIFQILTTLLSAHLVISNQISFGTMLAIQFIMGQLMGPMTQLMSAVINGYDAKISLDRLMDIWNVREEKDLFVKNPTLARRSTGLIGEIKFANVSFNYQGQETQFALNNIDLVIPDNKITAIVGMSGSGKTTLLKLLLGYYYNYDGGLYVNGTEFRSVDLKTFRSLCGAVLQESYIFNDTIANNVSLGLPVEEEKLRQALDIACILDYVDGLPLKTNTLIGNEGKGLSQGQKQRLLIARAIYKNPHYLLLDEATNSLDAKTEAEIFSKLKHYFVGRTVIMVAHRLSTVQHADKIVVLHKGDISEEGTHQQLLNNRREYYNLIKSQVGKHELHATVNNL